MQAYIQWVNSQLKKRPGGRVVESLEHDMKDGVAFLQLIEIVGNEQVEIIENPINITERSLNVKRVLRFMAKRKIKMHQINSKEIVEGNLKAIMRLILALAAHFKPGSVRPTNSGEAAHSRLERASSTMSLAAEAAVALADASQMASSAGLSLHYKYRKRPDFETQLTASDVSLSQVSLEPVHSRSSSSASSASHHSTGSYPQRGGTLPRPKPKKKYGDLTPTNHRSRKTSRDSGGLSDFRGAEYIRKSDESLHRKLSEDLHRRNVTRKQLVNSLSDVLPNAQRSSRPNSAKSTTSVDDHILAEEHDKMFMDVNVLKDCLLDLQQLILAGDELDDETANSYGDNSLHLEESSLYDQVAILNARLDQANREYHTLKNHASTLKEETVKLHGEKIGLQARLHQLEQSNIDLRSDQLRQELACDSAMSAKHGAQEIIDEREKQIASLHEDLARKDQVIERQRSQIEQLMEALAGRESTEADQGTQLCLRDNFGDNLRLQIAEITERLEGLSDSEAQINSQMGNYSTRLTHFEDSLNKSFQSSETSREYKKAFQTLRNLRSSFEEQDSRQHAIDTIEQCLSTMIESTTIANAVSKSHIGGNNIGKIISVKSRTRGTETPPKRNAYHKSNGILDDTIPKDSGKRTKVLYFVNQSITPYLGFINKCLGEIRLEDFKLMLNRPGRFRYFFKSVDADFGSVREEIISDDEVIPGWDGKVVSWLEEDRDLRTDYHNQSYDTSKRIRVVNGTQEDLV